MPAIIRHATIDDVEQLAPLFDDYRQFYGQPPDPLLAYNFLADRFRNRESIILIAESSGRLLGFTQLFPSFSSVKAGRTFILNDLFVTPGARRKGIAQALMAKAVQIGRSHGAARLGLSTARSNEYAQKLYESQGWKRDDLFLHYTFEL